MRLSDSNAASASHRRSHGPRLVSRRRHPADALPLDVSSEAPNVLLVEPHRDTAEMYAECFRHHRVKVTTVSNATDALAHVAHANVVVTNIRLPGDLDGIDLIVRLRHHKQTEHIPIAVLSAIASSSARERTRRAGCDVFLQKPCLPDVLVRQVRRLVRAAKQKAAGAAGAPLTIG